MKSPLQILVLACIGIAASAASAQTNSAAPPELPAVLKTIQPSPRSHEGAKGAELVMKAGVLGIRLNSKTPLTPQQWDAITSLHPRTFFFNDAALRDEDMDLLVALDPVSVELRITPLTDQGTQKFAQMPHLKRLVSHHLLTPMPATDELLSKHPTLEEFRSAGDFCIGALRSPKLKSVELAQNAATPARVEELAKHSKIESLSLFAHNIITVDDACMTGVAKIKTLNTLRLSFVPLTFDGGLKPLLNLPHLTELSLYMVDVPGADLEKFKASRPQVKVKLTPMSADYRKALDEIVAKASKPAPPK